MSENDISTEFIDNLVMFLNVFFFDLKRKKDYRESLLSKKLLLFSGEM